MREHTIIGEVRSESGLRRTGVNWLSQSKIRSCYILSAAKVKVNAISQSRSIS